MKFSTSLTVALAPLSMAGRVRRAASFAARSNHLVEEKAPEHVVAPVEHEVAPIEHVVAPVEHDWPVLEQHEKEATQVFIIWAYPGGAEAVTKTINEKVVVTETVTAPAEHKTEIAGGDGVTHTIDEGATATVPHLAASHTVKVGGPAGLVFEPPQLQDVPVGDTVIFEFLAENHTVTQSPFDDPCSALEGGMDTGHQPNPDNSIVPAPQVAMQIMASDPLWFYCKTGNHCGSGMVFSINPTAEKTHAQFQEKAIAMYGEGEQTPITGGDPPAETEAPAEEPPAEETPVEGGNGGTVPGNGVIGEDGSCLCMVSCDAGSFPVADVQGLGAYGGVPGGMPMSLEAIKRRSA